jgi:hypothetical protein
VRQILRREIHQHPVAGRHAVADIGHAALRGDVDAADDRFAP